MTTKIAGTKISARVGLTLESSYAAALGDPVMGGPGDWQVQLANGSQPLLGHVIMPNVQRGSGTLAGTYPQPRVPGDVTIDLKGHYVGTWASGATNFTAGEAVGVDANQHVVPYTGQAGVAQLGVALNGSSAAGTLVDVVVQ